jgi:hypothetical protein
LNQRGEGLKLKHTFFLLESGEDFKRCFEDESVPRLEVDNNIFMAIFHIITWIPCQLALSYSPSAESRYVALQINGCHLFDAGSAAVGYDIFKALAILFSMHDEQIIISEQFSYINGYQVSCDPVVISRERLVSFCRELSAWFSKVSTGSFVIIYSGVQVYGKRDLHRRVDLNDHLFDAGATSVEHGGVYVVSCDDAIVESLDVVDLMKDARRFDGLNVDQIVAAKRSDEHFMPWAYLLCLRRLFLSQVLVRLNGEEEPSKGLHVDQWGVVDGASLPSLITIFGALIELCSHAPDEILWPDDSPSWVDGEYRWQLFCLRRGHLLRFLREVLDAAEQGRALVFLS